MEIEIILISFCWGQKVLENQVWGLEMAGVRGVGGLLLLRVVVGGLVGGRI